MGRVAERVTDGAWWAAAGKRVARTFAAGAIPALALMQGDVAQGLWLVAGAGILALLKALVWLPEARHVNKPWWWAMLERAGASFAQVALSAAVVTADGTFDPRALDWGPVLQAGLVAGVTSALMAVLVGMPEVEEK